MARVESAGSMKGGAYGELRQKLPMEGSKIRELFDIFKANEGVPIKIKAMYYGYRSTEQLGMFYGLDLICLDRGRMNTTWVLAGEWFGSKYVDYIARRLESKTGNHGTPEK